jgi:hypothetical protein
VTISALKKKKLVPEQTGKKKNAPAKPGPQKGTSSKSLLAPSKRKPSVEIEDVLEEDNRIGAEVPRNPRNILEAADGSDDDENRDYPPPAAIVIDSPSDDDEDMVEIVDEPVEEDAEAELGLYLFSTRNS